MRILMINVVCGIRSTGRICTDIATELEKLGHEVKIAYGREDVPIQYKKYAVQIGTDMEVKLHGLWSRLTDGCGFSSTNATHKFIEWVKDYNPDVIHLHNIHGYYINVEILFDYLRTCGKRIIWTLHDCWSFTGHAAFCEAAQCERWTNGCYNCPKKDDYPRSLVDHSKQNWIRKKKIFTGIPNMTIVTPSQWLAGLTKRSFMGDYPIEVIPNGIDTSVFKHSDETLPTTNNLWNRKIVLGVASTWSERKGLSDFIKLRNLLDISEYLIILVGVSPNQIVSLPQGIIGVSRTNDVRELVAFYSHATVFVNPTYEDNYPTTNLEAVACETPVITYDTGGSPESACGGVVVPRGDIESVAEAIINIQDYNCSVDMAMIDNRTTVTNYLKLISDSH